MSLKLIINADDFGYTQGVNEGIVRAFRQGIVSSVSLMMNQAGTEHAIQLLRQRIIPRTGVHLCLTAGKPVCAPEQVRSLVDETGSFRTKDEFFKDLQIDQEQVYLEFKAQISKAKNTGTQITHLDTHHHVHSHPEVLQAFMKVSIESGLPVRSVNQAMRSQVSKRHILTPDFFCDEWFGEAVSLDAFKIIIEAGLINSRIQIMELMTHPGIVDQSLTNTSSYTYQREKELSILYNPDSKNFLTQNMVGLCSYEIFSR